MSSLLLLRSLLYANALLKSKKKKQKKPKKSYSLKFTGVKVTPGMCRICASENGDIPIFNNFVLPNIPEEIKNFSGVSISKSDSIKQMCQHCFDLLNGCIIFRDTCQRNNKKLMETSPSVKGEYVKCDVQGEDSNDSYNIPSPSFSEDTLWGCNTCGKDFHDMDSYNDHLSRCQGANPPKQPGEHMKRRFLCDVCGKTSNSNASLLVHMGIHAKVFPFKCDACPYQGRTMDLLKVHKRSHMQDKPFKCSQCPKATTTSSNLAKHMRHVHSTTRPFKCTDCDRVFSYQHDMNRHVREIHLRQSTVECEVCNEKFSTRKILRGHRLKIHKMKGMRLGRLPSYLQHQAEGEEQHDGNMSNYDQDPTY